MWTFDILRWSKYCGLSWAALSYFLYCCTICCNPLIVVLEGWWRKLHCIFNLSCFVCAEKSFHTRLNRAVDTPRLLNRWTKQSSTQAGYKWGQERRGPYIGAAATLRGQSENKAKLGLRLAIFQLNGVHASWIFYFVLYCVVPPLYPMIYGE